MAEYIERTEALEITTRTCGDYAAAWSEIRKLPAADVAPVVHGRFVHDGPRFVGSVDWWHCSSCGRLASGIETRFNYCSNCGAKMDLEEASDK